MKKTLLVLVVIIVVVVISLYACSQQPLEDMTLGEGNGCATIEWSNRIYVPYGALSAYGERGKQIGIVDGNKNDKVYECKGYSTDKWIVEALPNDPPML